MGPGQVLDTEIRGCGSASPTRRAFNARRVETEKNTLVSQVLGSLHEKVFSGEAWAESLHGRLLRIEIQNIALATPG